jgi:hypothetical protein
MPVVSQLGTVNESTYGTAVTVTRFVPLISEGIKPETFRTRTGALRAGKRTHRTDEVVLGVKGYAGGIEIPVESKGFGIWLARMLGQVATTGPTTSAYTHTGTIDIDDCPPSFTLQVNRPFAPCASTNQAFTYEGCQIASWELSCDVDGVAKLSAELICEDGTTATALATASYPTSVEPLSWASGSVTVNSVAVPVTTWKVACDNKLKTDRHYIANTTKRSKAPRSDFPEITADFTCDFDALATAYNRVIGSTVATVVDDIVFSAKGATLIGGSIYPEIRVTLPAAEFDEGSPNVSGTDMLETQVKVMALDDGTNEPISVAYVTADATP